MFIVCYGSAECTQVADIVCIISGNTVGPILGSPFFGQFLLVFPCFAHIHVDIWCKTNAVVYFASYKNMVMASVCSKVDITKNFPFINSF